MRLLRKLAVAILAIAVLIVAIAYLLPRQVHVERSIGIDSPRATVFTLVNSFKRFNEWSPWNSLDPNARYSYQGPAFGVGAKMTWEGDPKTMGSGSQEIIESKPLELVRTRLNFGAQGDATGQFALSQRGSSTEVTWEFDTDVGMNPVARYFGLLFDRMIGADYQKGLASLKTLAESLPKTDFADLQVEETTVPSVLVAYVEATSGKDDQEIAAAIGSGYARVGAFLATRGLKQAAPPITINRKWDDSGYEFDAAIPVDRTPEGEIPADSPVKIKSTYTGTALVATHKGPYRGMRSTYDKLFAYSKARGYAENGAPWDEYVSDPGSTPEADLVTRIYLPVK